MKLLLLFGPGAVGKMTVGRELVKQTGLKLFHNHMTIEPVIELFGTANFTVTNRLRDIYFEEFLKTDLEGIIFTFIWGFDRPSEWEQVDKLYKQFKEHGADVYFVELNASEAVRLERNRTEYRLQEKASKRDLVASEERLLNIDKQYRCVSQEGEVTYPNYLRIINDDLSAEEVASMIREHFSL